MPRSEGRAPDSGSGIPELSLGPRRTPPDEAQAPIIDYRSGRWTPEPFARRDAAPTPAGDGSTPERGGRVRSHTSDVSWESGLQVPGDSELDSAAGNAGDSHRPDLFCPAPEPEDVEPMDVDETHHATTANDDGASGSVATRPGATKGDDSKELARALDGAELPLEDLEPVDLDSAERARRSILEDSDGRPVPDSYRDIR